MMAADERRRTPIKTHSVYPRSSAFIGGHLLFPTFSPFSTTHFTQFRADPKRLTSYDLVLPRYNDIGGTFDRPNRSLIAKDCKLTNYQTNPSFRPTPTK